MIKLKRKSMLEQGVTRLERERMYNNTKAMQGIPTLVARSLDSDDEVYFLCEFPNTLKGLKDVLIDLLINEDYDELSNFCKRNYIRWFDLLEEQWRFKYSEEYCAENDCDPEIFGGVGVFLFIDDDKTATPLNIIEVVECHFD